MAGPDPTRPGPHLWEPIAEGAELEVRGAKIVPPLRHAVALVYRKQRQTGACFHPFQPAIPVGHLNAPNQKTRSGRQRFLPISPMLTVSRSSPYHTHGLFLADHGPTTVPCDTSLRYQQNTRHGCWPLEHRERFLQPKTARIKT